MNVARFLYFLLLSTICTTLYAQSDNPWSLFASLDWNNNSNITEFGTGSNTGYTVTSEASVGNPTAPSCGAATNDLWYRIPYRAGTTSVTVKVTFTNSDYTPSIDDTRPRYAIYKAPAGSCTASGSCNLSYYGCNSDNDLDENGEQECFGSSLYYTNLTTNNVPVSNEDVFVRIWEQDNDPEHRYTIHAVRNGTSPSTPNNDACSSPQLIVSGAPCPYSGSNYSAGGGQFPALGSDACSWGLQENNVYYEFEATATSVNIQMQNVRCFWTGCTNVPGLSLQYAIFRKRTSCTSTSYPGDVMNVPSNSTYDCFIGQGTVGGVVDGLTIGQRYLIVLDGWNASPCTWDGITITNTPTMPTINSIRKCISDTGTVSTLTISNTRPTYSYTWTASPADPTLAGQTTNASINVKPLVTTTYTATINLGSSGLLCNGTSAAAYPLVTTINILDPVATRISPTGAQCSGTQLNFTSSPTGGNGTYTYNWTSNNPSGTSGSGANFSFIPSNTTCSDIQLSVNLSVTSNGLTCPRSTAFTPTIRPVPTLTALPNVECLTGNVRAGQATIGSCSCTACSYTLEACSGCGLGSTPVGTTDTSRNFILYDANGATFSATLNGCKSANQARNFLVDCPTQLPVELTHFSANCVKENINLNWTTASESDNSHFEIEKSVDAINWKKIQIVGGSGNSNQIKHYQYLDLENNQEQIYYRLKQVDFDGTFEYSIIISRNCGNATTPILTVFPNPVSETIYIQYQFEEKQNTLNYILFDDIGREIQSFTYFLQENKSTGILQIPAKNLANGIYFIKITTDSNLNEIRKLLIK